MHFRRSLRPHWTIVVGVAFVLCVITATSPTATDNLRIAQPPALGREQTDPLVDDMRSFLRSRGMPLDEAAKRMRSPLAIPASDDMRSATGCHGPVPNMERSARVRDPMGSSSQATLDAFIASLVEDGPADLVGLVKGLEAADGRIRLDDQGQLDDSTIALSVGNDLIVSDAWLQGAMADPTSVYGSLAHEIAGHMSYDTPLGCLIIETALSGSSAMSDFDTYRAAYLTYVYPETEIYAELHELPYVVDGAIGDDPYIDIMVQIQRIEAAYPPELAGLILEWLRLRCQEDQLASEARFYCAAALG